ncbi:MAG: tyrosine-protein phosphatase [Thermoleophilaceae bacterium]
MRTDLHFHLLPGLDDGPAQLDDSVELARAAAAEGTRAIVATPHVRHDYVTDVNIVPALVREVQRELDSSGIGITVECGGELGADMVGVLGQEELETIAVGPRGRRWLLLETPFGGIDQRFHDAAEELRDRGFAVVLAHPERCVSLFEDDSLGLRRELARGALLQVNGGSIAGVHGPAPQEAALRLIGCGLVAAIASDAHSQERLPMLENAYLAMLENGIHPARAAHLTDCAPGRLLRKGIPAHKPVPVAA